MSSNQHGFEAAIKHVLVLGTLAGVVACHDEPLKPRAGETKLKAEVVDSSDFYYFDHKPIYLAEDPSRLVIATAGASIPDVSSLRAATGTLLRASKVAPGGIERLPGSRAHWLMELPAMSGAARASVRKTLAADSRIKSVTPAFTTVDGNRPLLVLNLVVAEFKPRVSARQVEQLVTSLGGVVTRAPVPDSNSVTYQIEPRAGSGVDALHLANAIDRSSLAKWASPDMISPTDQPNSIPTDPYFQLQYYLANPNHSAFGVPVDIDVERAWDLTKGSSTIRIIFIDTGIDSLLPEFGTRGHLMIALDEMPTGGPPRQPGEGPGHPYTLDTVGNHGTAIASVALAAHDGLGMAGIAPNVSIGAVRIFRAGLSASYNDRAAAFDWAASHGDVINNSWGECTAANSILQSAVQRALTTGRAGKGAVVVFSAGNSMQNGCTTTQTWESQIPGVITVAALTNTGAQALYSLTGPAITVSAFGGAASSSCLHGDILAAMASYNTSCSDVLGLKYTYGVGGTSAAAAQVSGIAALLLSREPTLTAAQVKSRIMAGAINWGNGTIFGYGKVSAYNTLVPPLSVHGSGPSKITVTGTYHWTATASGGTGPITIQWQFSDDQGTTWDNAPVGATFTRLERVDESFYIRPTATAAPGQSAIGNIVKVDVYLEGGGGH
ncbi:MAG TPA: S8 family serine peptidase [Gemmatimonadaceae bacterium]|nr:S8 family serine peptidase [Gemmatimonadaceae bacterium]